MGTKITDLTATSSPATSDIIPIVVDPSGTPLNRKVTIANLATAIGAGGTPGGSNTQIQYKNSSAFGGVSGATSDGTNITFGSSNLRATSPRITTGLLDTNGNPIVAFTATASAVDGLTITNAATADPATVTIAATSSVDSNINIALTPKGTGTVQVGTGNTGILSGGSLLMNGSSSGVITIQPATAAGTWTLTLPTDDGTSGQVLQTNGSGVTSWATSAGGSGAVSAADSATVLTDESTTSTTYADLTTTTDSVTLTTGTTVIVTICAEIYEDGAITDTARFAVAVSGATTTAAADANCATIAQTLATAPILQTVSRTFKMTVTAGSNTFKMKYKTGTGGVIHFLRRSITVLAI